MMPRGMMTNSFATLGIARLLVLIPAAFVALMVVSFAAGTRTPSPAQSREMQISTPLIHTVISGTTSLSVNSARSTSSSATWASELGPLSSGMHVNVFVDVASVTQPAEDQLTLLLADTSGSVLTTDSVRGLHIQVFECPERWSQKEGTCQGTGGRAVALAAPAAALVSSPMVLNVSTLEAGSKIHLRIQLTLASATQESYADIGFDPIVGENAEVFWTISER